LTVVVLYTRPGCHLCDEARDLILSLRESDGDFELREVDIDADDDLHARYLERIPVVEVDGEVVAELHLEPDQLGRALGFRGTGTVRSMIEDPGPKQ
jgi:glutaredoxin